MKELKEFKKSIKGRILLGIGGLVISLYALCIFVLSIGLSACAVNRILNPNFFPSETIMLSVLAIFGLLGAAAIFATGIAIILAAIRCKMGKISEWLISNFTLGR